MFKVSRVNEESWGQVNSLPSDLQGQRQGQLKIKGFWPETPTLSETLNIKSY